MRWTGEDKRRARRHLEHVFMEAIVDSVEQALRDYDAQLGMGRIEPWIRDQLSSDTRAWAFRWGLHFKFGELERRLARRLDGQGISPGL